MRNTMTYSLLGKTGLRVSRVGLGTAEIGSAYGIGPRSFPDAAAADAFLRAAADLGINFFDTAGVYGVAEERLRTSGLPQREGIVIASKCGQFLERGEDPPADELRARIRADVEASLRALDTDHIALLQLHGGTQEQLRRGDVLTVLTDLKKEGKVRALGIASRGVDAYLAALQTGVFDVLQLAYSILDQRMAERVLPEAKRCGLGVVARSVLLKGALSDRARHLHPRLVPVSQKVEEIAALAARSRQSLPSLAFRFALPTPGLTTVLVGTNQLAHLQEAIKAALAPPLSSELMSELQAMGLADPALVDPKQWPKT